ncbi:hypothetical protein J7T55_004262 [Diaporthe amygdali]|uniref:uncharacterized protein n=1 Tax=Phomopsis amygdali TaxID=1214568 RepID=UPI0022FF2341|nr:uncharacterized protein J7T55_004262 [Diaporthe amygdali]KAJ0100751.1 hypothetical protein J7T55_004262 [Diaporthe amygdali]
MAARRVFLSVSAKSSHWPQVCESAEEAVRIAVELIKKENIITQWGVPRLLVEERWGSRTHIVFDILHDTYSSQEAHLPGHGNLPVIAVWLSKKEVVQTASEGIQKKVNDEVWEVHRLSGKGSEPPFFIDHSGGKVPIFMNPRTTKTS